MPVTNSTRFKTYAAGSSFPPSDMNSIQDVFGLGKSNISTTGTRTNVAYGALTDGPDQVTNVALPTDGLIAVTFQATWQESVVGAASAAIFIGANQLKVADDANAAPQVSETTIRGSAAAAHDKPLISHPSLGLASSYQTPTGYSGDVTTGQIAGMVGATANFLPAGGPCYIFAAAGNYTISVQFKASSGSVTAKNRKLWVWTLGA